MGYLSIRLLDIANTLDRDLGPSDHDREILREAAFLFDDANMSRILPFMVRDNEEALRAGLSELNSAEMGKMIAIVLGVLIDRGVDLRSFLPKLSSSLLNDAEVAAALRVLGER